MSLEEKEAMAHIDSLIRLWLKESPNEYILEKTVYGRPVYKANSSGKMKLSYKKGYFRVREKYSPVKLTVTFTQLRKYIKWRNEKFLPERYKLIKFLLTKEDNEFKTIEDLNSYVSPDIEQHNILQTQTHQLLVQKIERDSHVKKNISDN